MNQQGDSRLDDLFIRYWDNALAPAEAEELARVLECDPVARDQFQLLSMQAVVAAELPPYIPPQIDRQNLPAPAPEEVTSKARRGWSRRRLLTAIGGGLAAGIGGILAWRFGSGEEVNRRVKLVSAQGGVVLRDAAGNVVPTLGRILSGTTITTQGFSANAVLQYRDGSTICVLGDSAVAVHDDGDQIQLLQGTATASILPQSEPEGRPTLASQLVTLRKVSGAFVTLAQGALTAEVEVHHGTVAASHPSGEPMAVVGTGEVLTIRGDGEHQMRRTPPTPDFFNWDFNRPSPGGWKVGSRGETPAGPVIRPEFWPDPFYKGTEMYQIRSEQPWARGWFRLQTESTIRVRYRVKKTGAGQLCFCVRRDKLPSSETGMLEYDGDFVAAEAGEWQWLTVHPGEMLANRYSPRFAAPWVAFLVIFNTYESDLGLEIAEFRVTPPELPHGADAP